MKRKTWLPLAFAAAPVVVLAGPPPAQARIKLITLPVREPPPQDVPAGQ